jgi:hypothetical protein
MHIWCNIKFDLLILYLMLFTSLKKNIKSIGFCENRSVFVKTDRFF